MDAVYCNIVDALRTGKLVYPGSFRVAWLQVLQVSGCRFAGLEGQRSEVRDLTLSDF
jgi:hypothetical protein